MGRMLALAGLRRANAYTAKNANMPMTNSTAAQQARARQKEKGEKRKMLANLPTREVGPKVRREAARINLRAAGPRQPRPRAAKPISNRAATNF